NSARADLGKDAIIRPEAVIFDFDFTLADSSRAVVECVTLALSEVGLQTPPAEKIVETIGLSLAETLRHLTGAMDAGLAKRFARCFHQRADQIMDSVTVIYDSVWPVMRSLHAANIRAAI